MAISRYQTSIDSDEVAERIGELEDSADYEVVRTRTDEVITTFNEREDAENYISEEDYNPERVIVRQEELGTDDAAELAALTALQNELGSGSWTIYNDDYFDSDWARDQARETLGRGVDLDSWPLNQIDWSEAAEEERDSLYPYTYSFDGGLFYADE